MCSSVNIEILLPQNSALLAPMQSCGTRIALSVLHQHPSNFESMKMPPLTAPTQKLPSKMADIFFSFLIALLRKHPGWKVHLAICHKKISSTLMFLYQAPAIDLR